LGELTTPFYQKTDSDVPDNDPYSDGAFLSADAVNVDIVNKTNSSQWNITATVGVHPVLFKVDTGAEVTVLSENLFHDSVPKFQKSTHTLRGANRTPLDVLGEAQMKLLYNAKSSTQQVFVVQDPQHNLLGLPAIRDLEVITGINAIELSIPDQYPALFTGLGTFKGEYTIKLKPDTQLLKPFSQEMCSFPFGKK